MNESDEKHNILDEETPPNAPLSAKYKRFVSQLVISFKIKKKNIRLNQSNSMVIFRIFFQNEFTEVLHITPFRNVCRSF